MTDKHQIKIASLYEVFALISTKKTSYNIVSIQSTEEAEEIQDMFNLYIENFNSVYPVIFDDITEPFSGYTMPNEKDIKDVLEWCRNKDDLLVHCSAGISRSSALAYLIECSRKPPHKAVKILNSSIYLPNRLILEIGSRILDNPDILEIFEKSKAVG